MKHYYLHILLLAIGYTNLVAQNEMVINRTSEKVILDGPITQMNTGISCDTTSNVNVLELSRNIEAIAKETQQDTPEILIVEEVTGHDPHSLYSDGTAYLNLSEPIVIDALFMYPNPTNGMVQIKLPGKVSIHVYTLAGQLVSRHQMPPGERMLDLTSLPTGIYQIRAKSDEDYFSGKLLIQ